MDSPSVYKVVGDITNTNYSAGSMSGRKHLL